MRLAMGFQRTKEAIRGVGAARISVAAQRAIRYPRAKDLPIMWRAWLRRMRFAPPELSAADPQKWRNLIATAGLSGGASEEQWRKLLGELKEILILAPSDLAELGEHQLHIVSEDPQSNRLLGQLWRAAEVAGGAEELAERTCPSTYVLQGWDAYELANATSADSAKDSELGRTFSPCASELGLSAEQCDSMGPKEKPRRVAGGATSSGQISRLPRAGSQLNLIRNCDASLKSAAAGIRCWGCLCNVAMKPHFPPTEEGVLARSSFFGAGRSFCSPRLPGPSNRCLLKGFY